MNIKIREALISDEPFLREMLFQAIYVEEGDPQKILQVTFISEWGLSMLE